MKTNKKLDFLSFSFANAQQLPRQREPDALINLFIGSR